MAQPSSSQLQPQGDDLSRELRESLHTIERQRNAKRLFVLIALASALVLAGFAVYLMYGSAPGTMRMQPSERGMPATR